MDFSLFYFAADAGDATHARPLPAAARGRQVRRPHGFAAVWTPERHFHEFGGLYPNPAVTSAAVAAITERVEIRAGSVVLPLHNPIRVAEDWSVVDNLSNGRVGLSFASGWHANDFALAPDNFARPPRADGRGHRDRSGPCGAASRSPRRSGDGREIEVTMFPPPVQRVAEDLDHRRRQPGDVRRWPAASGASILTNLLVMNHDDLVANIAAYRAAYRAAGHPGDGHVS